jgi:hypothetical protein
MSHAGAFMTPDLHSWGYWVMKSSCIRLSAKLYTRLRLTSIGGSGVLDILNEQNC